MINAIVYTSSTGTTEWYAKRLGEELKLPVFPLKEAERELAKGAEIVYLGCIRANMISGLDKAKKILLARLDSWCGADRKREK